MEERQKIDKQRRFFAFIMMASGLYIWMTAGSGKEIFQDINLGLGIFLFVMGTMNLEKANTLSELSSKKKKKKLIIIAILGIAVLLGVLFSYFQ